MTLERGFFTAGGERLAFLWRGGGSTALIFAHGLFSDKEGAKAKALQALCQQRGLGFLSFDFAGCGESEGDVSDTTLTGRIAQLRSAMDFAASRGAREIVLVGSSFGGCCVLFAAGEPAVQAAVFVATPFDFRLFGDPPSGEVVEVDGYPLKRRFFEDLKGYDPKEAASKIKHALVIHGEKDGVVPISHGRALFAALSEPKASLWLPTGDHRLSDRADLEAAIAKIGAWLARCGIRIGT